MDASLARDSELAVKLIYKHFKEAEKIIESYFIENHIFNDQI